MRRRATMFRVSRVLLGALFVSLGAVLLVFWPRSSNDGAPPGVLAPARADPNAALSRPTAAPPRSAAGTGHIEAAGAATAPPATEVCGHGRVRLDLNDVQAQQRFTALLIGAQESTWISQLQDSGDLRTRAAGLLLDGRKPGDTTITSASATARNSMTQIAFGSTDPALYGLTLNMCRLYGHDADVPLCDQMSAQRWSQLDPGNAAPWLLLAAQAHAVHDGIAETDAWVQAARSRTLTFYDDAVVKFVSSALPAGLTPFERVALQQDVGSYAEMLGNPPYALLLAHCSAEAVRAANRADTCSKVASVLVEHGRSLMDLSVGLRLGENSGWAAGRVAALREERDAMRGALGVVAGPQPLSCDGLRRLEPVIAGMIEDGQLGAGRAAIRASTVDLHELARKSVAPFDAMVIALERQAKAAPNAL